MAEPSWRTWTEHASTRKVYVDASRPDDSGDGLSAGTAKKTVAAGLALIRNGFPDWLLFKCGEVWTGETLAIADDHVGLDASNPIIISSYGSGARPRFDTGRSTFCDCSSSNIVFDDLELYAHERDPNNGAFAGWPQATSGSPFGIVLRGDGPTNNVVIQNCRVRYFDIGIAALKNNATARGVEDCVIRGNVVEDSWADTTVGNHTQGFYLENMVRGVVEDNFADRCGWNPDDGTQTYGEATIYNHGFYILDTFNSTYRRNWSSRASSFGFKLASNWLKYSPDARWEDCDFVDNLALECPNAFSVGGHGTVYAYLRCTFTHNVATRCGSSRNGAFAYQRFITSASGADDFLYDRNLAVDDDDSDSAFDARGFIEAGWGDSAPGVYRNVRVTNNVAFDHPIGSSAGPTWGWNDDQQTGDVANITCNGGIVVTGNEDNLAGGGYPDSSRTALSYSTFIGEDGTLAALYAIVRAQRRGAWDDNVTAAALNSYLRGGFGISDPDSSPAPPPAPTERSYVLTGGSLVLGVKTGGA